VVDLARNLLRFAESDVSTRTPGIPRSTGAANPNDASSTRESRTHPGHRDEHEMDADLTADVGIRSLTPPGSCPGSRRSGRCVVTPGFFFRESNFAQGPSPVPLPPEWCTCTPSHGTVSMEPARNTCGGDDHGRWEQRGWGLRSGTNLMTPRAGCMQGANRNVRGDIRGGAPAWPARLTYSQRPRVDGNRTRKRMRKIQGGLRPPPR